jgi:glycine cleavage system aminomethyltransferase T
MSFEFLAPAAARAFDGVMPPMRSPIEWLHRDAGARFGERAGWRVVTGYGESDHEAAACRAAVGVADLSFLGKIELRGEAGVVSSIVSELAGGAALEPGRASLHDGVWWCPVTSEYALALTPPEATAQVTENLESAASAARFASVHELTAAFGSNAVVGPRARETFARASALDMRPRRFPERGFAPVSVARTPGMVLREGGDRFLHLFGAGYAVYIWTVFVDAARSLGGRAVGVAALPSQVGGKVTAVA